MKTINNKNFNQPYIPSENLITDVRVSISRQPYMLEKDMYKLLINGSPFFILEIVNGLFCSSVFYGVLILARYYGKSFNSVENWEILIVLLVISICLIIYGAYYFVPTEKKILIKNIQSHFANDRGEVIAEKIKRLK